ncbi:MAG: hypothetical protein IKX54_06010 [Lachnospiraceae bacterium]|nr:hypothetical protein [Lachnospiraceae bacterium]
MKWSWKRFWIAAGIMIALLAICGWAVMRDYSNQHVVTKLAKYRGLTVDAEGKEAEEAVTAAIVAKSKYGRALETETKKEYENSMFYFEQEAKYFKMTLDEYVQKNYAMDEASFRKKVRDAAEDTVKTNAVLKEIAKREEITFSDEEFAKTMPYIMEAYGYTDEEQMAKEVDLISVRDALFLEKVRAYLVEVNTVVNAKTEPEE